MRIRERTVTVTVSRTRSPSGHDAISESEPFMALTVALAQCSKSAEWGVTDAIDEDGNPVTLTETETLLARCLAAAGVDETGV